MLRSPIVRCRLYPYHQPYASHDFNARMCKAVLWWEDVRWSHAVKTTSHSLVQLWAIGCKVRHVQMSFTGAPCLVIKCIEWYMANKHERTAHLICGVPESLYTPPISFIMSNQMPCMASVQEFLGINLIAQSFCVINMLFYLLPPNDIVFYTINIQSRYFYPEQS